MRLLALAGGEHARHRRACGSDDESDERLRTDDHGRRRPRRRPQPVATEAGRSVVDLCRASARTRSSIQTDWNPEAEHGVLYQMLGGRRRDRRRQEVGQRPADGRRGRHRRRARGPRRRSGDRLPDRHLADVPGRRHHSSATSTPTRRSRTRPRFPTVAIVAPLRDEPADDHVGPGHLPGRRDDRRPRRGRRASSATSRRGLHGVPRSATGILDQGSGRRLLRRHPGAVRRRRGQGRPAGLRLGRAVHLRERGRRLGQGRSPTQLHQRRGLEQLRRGDRDQAGEHRPPRPTASPSWSRSSSRRRSTTWPIRQRPTP